MAFRYKFRLKFHWILFLWVQLTIFQHWFRKWLDAVQATSHYLNQWWLVYRRIYMRPSASMSLISDSMLHFNPTYCDISKLHPCEKVIGIFFRHTFFITQFLLFVLVFIHNICEVVSMDSFEFCWISITGYISVTFWKRLQGENPMSH